MNTWHDWQKILFGVFSGLLAAGLVAIVSFQPRGTPVLLEQIPTAAPISVHVAGAVTRPGVYQLPAGSRVQHAVEAAGGYLDTANLEAINLAAQLADGAKIFVPKIGDSGESSKSLVISGTLVNINSASFEELMTLPGIGEDRANQIIKYREDHNGFETIEELQNVSGIGGVTFENLKSLVTVIP